MQHKFPQHHRLKNKSQFQFVFQNGKKISFGKKIALFFKLNELGYSRLGISVPNRNVKNAAARNRIKRLMRESFRLQQLLLDNDIIVVAYAGAANLSNSAITECLAELWQKLNALQKA
jgi:ribonuclease P protein component